MPGRARTRPRAAPRYRGAVARLDVRGALRAAQLVPESVPDVVVDLGGGLGATDVTLYLVDFAQTVLQPVPGRSIHPDVPEAEGVASSMAGRAFTDGTATTAERSDGTRVWVPVVEGSDRTGVLALTVPEADDAMLAMCEDLGLLTGYLLATQARTTDVYNLHRRRRSLSLAASMQWDLLPPLVLKTARLTVAGILEPAYEVGGDCFDYALNHHVLDVAIVDALGHGVSSSLIAALALGSYRHDRREGRSLDVIHTRLDQAIAANFPDFAFATGQAARLDVETGAMTWTNAGHPLPLLIRGGRVVAELTCRPTPPWGLGATFGPTIEPTVASVELEPGDGVLFYTDGVIEAHATGAEPFGVDRLRDLVGRHASDQLEPEETLRHLVAAVLDYQDAQLADDATLLLVQWNGPPS